MPRRVSHSSLNELVSLSPSTSNRLRTVSESRMHFCTKSWRRIQHRALTTVLWSSKSSLKKKKQVVLDSVVGRTESTRYLARTDFPHPGSADTQSILEDLLSR